MSAQFSKVPSNLQVEEEVDDSHVDQPVEIRDMDEEKLLRHFVLEDQAKEIIRWCEKNYDTRPSTAHERLDGAMELRSEGNKLVEKQVCPHPHKRCLCVTRATL